MKRLTTLFILSLRIGTACADAPAPAVEAPALAVATLAPAVIPAGALSDPDIHKAIVATLKEDGGAGKGATFGRTDAAVYAHNPAVDTPQLNQYQAFAIAFDKAKLPDCLHADGLKYQPVPPIVPQQFLLPFILIAKLRGVCL